MLIFRGAFARNTVLRVLNMSKNKIRKLDQNSFRGMRFLRRLFLSDNVISDVGRGTFSSLKRIGTIDLARNLIRKIDYQMFYQLNFIEVRLQQYYNTNIIAIAIVFLNFFYQYAGLIYKMFTIYLPGVTNST